MTQTVFNVVLIFLFILIGGVFAAAEMALVRSATARSHSSPAAANGAD